MTAKNKINFSTSAPGKIIIFGEHSVVYGKLALASSISCRTTAFFTETEKNVITLNFSKLRFSENFEFDELKNKLNESLPLKNSVNQTEVNLETVDLIDIDALIKISEKDINIDSADENKKRIKNALHVFFLLFRGILSSTNVDLSPFSLRVQSELTLGAGTGSSASFCVTVAAALLFLLKQKQFPQNDVSKTGYRSFKFDEDSSCFSEKEKEILNKWAFCGEKINHGNPSGLDNSICTFGSTIEINRGAKGAVSFLKNTPQISLLLINSGVGRNTSVLVEKVRNLKKKHEGIVNCILDGMDGVAEKAVSTLKTLKELEDQKADENIVLEQYSCLEELFDLNHGLLSALNVSHEKLEHIRALTAEYNLHTKLTGAGGGGYAITLIPPNYPLGKLMECVNQLQANSFRSDQIFLGGEGVTVKLL